MGTRRQGRRGAHELGGWRLRNRLGPQHDSGADIGSRPTAGPGRRSGDSCCRGARHLPGSSHAASAGLRPHRGGRAGAGICAGVGCTALCRAVADAEPDAGGNADRRHVRAADHRRPWCASAATRRCPCDLAHRDRHSAAGVGDQHQCRDARWRPIAAQGKTAHFRCPAIVARLSRPARSGRPSGVPARRR